MLLSGLLLLLMRVNRLSHRVRILGVILMKSVFFRAGQFAWVGVLSVLVLGWRRVILIGWFKGCTFE